MTIDTSMTLRQWYAGQMLAGMSGAGIDLMRLLKARADELKITPEALAARMCLAQADALIEAEKVESAKPQGV
jgi:ATP-dependent protease HslVU (ClpYQ) peptidase subunit